MNPIHSLIELQSMLVKTTSADFTKFVKQYSHLPIFSTDSMNPSCQQYVADVCDIATNLGILVYSFVQYDIYLEYEISYCLLVWGNITGFKVILR